MTSSQKTLLLFKTFFKMWGLYILFFIILGVLSVWIPELKPGRYEDTALKELVQKSPLKLFILACIFAPIVEEMMFRTLIKPSHNHLILFICSWPVFIGLRFLPKTIYWGVIIVFAVVLLFTLFYIVNPVSYTNLRAHETALEILCRFLLEKTINN